MEKVLDFDQLSELTTRVHLAADAQGRAVRFSLTAGQASDGPQAVRLKASRAFQEAVTLQGGKHNPDAFVRVFQGQEVRGIRDIVVVDLDQRAETARAADRTCRHFRTCHREQRDETIRRRRMGSASGRSVSGRQ